MENGCLHEYSACSLCARSCGVNRSRGELGFCRSTSTVRIARAALHHWEEPVISGARGSGTIFFSGCSLGCLFCQNREISGSEAGRDISIFRLAEIMRELERAGAHNINLVTPTHYAPSIIRATELARADGLGIPIVYNTGTYDTVDTVKSLRKTVDIYLADYKYNLEKTARVWAKAEKYPEVAKAAMAEMVKQRGAPVIEDGIMRSGVIVRILLLPSHLAEAKLSVKYLYETYGDSIYISLMNQYTPMPSMPPPLNRRVTREEYSELVDYAISKGVRQAFIQEDGTATESFIPPFDLTGV
ncbi:MAG: radical SAM protein [Clostridia bacterium]|nr:radical SAM protein [Clostridia bacterium]